MSLAKSDVETFLDQLIAVGKYIRLAGAGSRARKADSLFNWKDYQSLCKREAISDRANAEDLQELRSHLLFLLFVKPLSQGNESSEETQFGRNDNPAGNQKLVSPILDHESKFQRLPSDSQRILHKLIFMNLRRRNRFWYAKQHAKKLGDDAGIDAEMSSFLEPQQAAESGKRDSNAPSKPNDQLNESARLEGPREGTSTLPSVYKVDMANMNPLAPSALGTSRKSVSLKKTGWPRPPKLVSDRKTFQCPCCSLTLSPFGNNAQQWRHVHFIVRI